MTLGIRAAMLAGALVLPILLSGAASAQSEFPYDRELLLDAKPLRGGKRIPSLQVEASGAAAVDLWCRSYQAQAIVAGDTITLIFGTATDLPCTPERAQADEALLAALTHATTWRRDGDDLILDGADGARPVRFRAATN